MKIKMEMRWVLPGGNKEKGGNEIDTWRMI